MEYSMLHFHWSAGHVCEGYDLVYDNSTTALAISDGSGTSNASQVLAGSSGSWSPSSTPDVLNIYTNDGPIAISSYNFVVSGITDVEVSVYNGATEIGSMVRYQDFVAWKNLEIKGKWELRPHKMLNTYVLFIILYYL